MLCPSTAVYLMLWNVVGRLPEFSVFLRDLRETRGLSKAALASRAKVDPTMLTRWENGHVPIRSDSRESLRRVGDVLNDGSRLLQLAGHEPRPDEPKMTQRRPPFRDFVLSEPTLRHPWQRRALLNVYESLVESEEG